MPSYKAAQQYGLTPTITPEYLEAARSMNEKNERRVSDLLIAEEIANSQKDKDFTDMWAKRRSGGEEAARKLLNYYTYGDPNYGQQESNVQYQFTQKDAAGYFNDSAKFLQQIGASVDSKPEEKRGLIPDENIPHLPQIPKFSWKNQKDLQEEHPVLGSIAQPLKQVTNFATGVANIPIGLADAAIHPEETLTSLAKLAIGLGAKVDNVLPKWMQSKGMGNSEFMQEAMATADAFINTFRDEDTGKVSVNKQLFERPEDIVLSFLGPKDITKAVKESGKKITQTIGRGAEEAYGASTGAQGALTEFRHSVRGEGGVLAPKVKNELATGLRQGETAMPRYAERLNNALSKVAMKRRSEYAAALKPISEKLGFLDNTKVESTFDDALKGWGVEMDNFKLGGTADDISKTFAGTTFAKNAETVSEFQRIIEHYKTWTDYTAAGWDLFKKQLDDMGISTPKGEAFKTQLYDSVREMLDNQVPGYSKMTGRYAELSDLMKQVRQELSAGADKNPGTTVRKIQQVFRQGFGNRKDLLEEVLKEAGDTTTIPGMSAAQLSSVMPKGILRALGGGVLGAAGTALFYGNVYGALALVGGLVFTSPRIAAGVLRGIGFTQRQADKFIEFTRKLPPNLQDAIKNAGSTAVGSEIMLDRAQENPTPSEPEFDIESLFPSQ